MNGARILIDEDEPASVGVFKDAFTETFEYLIQNPGVEFGGVVDFLQRKGA